MKKNNLVTMGVSFLLCVGMVGAGFASWVISADVNEDLNSTVKVEEVIDRRLVLTTSTKNAEGSGELWDADLYFGAPKDNATAPDGYTSNQYSWLSNNGTEKEDLDVYVEVVLNYDNLKELSEKSAMDTITLEFVLDKTEEGGKKVLADVIGSDNTFAKSLVNEPIEMGLAEKDEADNNFTAKAGTEFVNKGVDDFLEIKDFKATINIKDLMEVAEAALDDETDATFRYIFKFTYTWGDLFKDTTKNANSVNPFYFFNSYENSKSMGTYTVFGSSESKNYSYADVALESLQKLANINVKNATENNYKIGLTAKVSKTAQA